MFNADGLEHLQKDKPGNYTQSYVWEENFCHFMKAIFTWAKIVLGHDTMLRIMGMTHQSNWPRKQKAGISTAVRVMPYLFFSG